MSLLSSRSFSFREFLLSIKESIDLPCCDFPNKQLSYSLRRSNETKCTFACFLQELNLSWQVCRAVSEEGQVRTKKPFWDQFIFFFFSIQNFKKIYIYMFFCNILKLFPETRYVYRNVFLVFCPRILLYYDISVTLFCVQKRLSSLLPQNTFLLQHFCNHFLCTEKTF